MLCEYSSEYYIYSLLYCCQLRQMCSLMTGNSKTLKLLAAEYGTSTALYTHTLATG